jgi:hypothetical protein
MVFIFLFASLVIAKYRLRSSFSFVAYPFSCVILPLDFAANNQNTKRVYLIFTFRSRISLMADTNMLEQYEESVDEPRCCQSLCAGRHLNSQNCIPSMEGASDDHNTITKQPRHFPEDQSVYLGFHVL